MNDDYSEIFGKVESYKTVFNEKSFLALIDPWIIEESKEQFKIQFHNLYEELYAELDNFYEKCRDQILDFIKKLADLLLRLIELNNISESILLAREFITYYREQFKKYNSFVESTNFQGEPTVSDKDLEILYSCWRDEEKDKEFNHKMYQFRVKIQAKKDILDRIEYVIYRLSTAYKNNLRKTNDRANNFMLKELAWGVSDIQVEIKIYNQTEIINLTQRVYLTETGPRYD